ncbi:MAG TPA: hypothetical protein DCO77_04330, partial [Nitrospiraceae bacterium]|nr:hypothetical protein [Nitrospiraceae bacterium]
LVYDTLKKWNMDQRTAKLVSFDDFWKSIRGLLGDVDVFSAFLTSLGQVYEVRVQSSGFRGKGSGFRRKTG